MENNVTETLKGEAYSGLCRVNAATSPVREEQSSEPHPMHVSVQHRWRHKPPGVSGKITALPTSLIQPLGPSMRE